MDTIPQPVPKNGYRIKYFNKEILVLKIFGLSLAGNEGIAYKIYSLLFLTATIFAYPILDFYEYFKHDVSVAADIIIYQVAGVMAFGKATVLFRNRDKIMKFLIKLEQKPFLPNLKRGGKREEELVQECVWITSMQTFLYWTLSCISIAGTIIYGYTKHMKNNDFRQFPYGPFTVLNITYSPNYDITYCYQSISIVVIASLFTSTDLLLAGVLAHISYQFKMLQNNFRRLVETSYEDMIKDTGGLKHNLSKHSNVGYEFDGSDISWKYLKKSAKKSIEYHSAIIDIATEVEQTFSDLLLLVFLGTLALLCFTIYSASSNESDTQIIVRHIVEGICASLQVGTVCFWGEQVLHESQQVGRAAYESNFVGTDLRFQKLLILIIRRTQNPIRITTGGFSDICLSTFAWILRTSYSSFMVLRRADT